MLEYVATGDDMETIKLSSINMNYLENFIGSYSIVQKCEYSGKLYAYKRINNVKIFEKNINKLKKISKINLDCLITPKYLVYDDSVNELNAYLTDFVDYKACSELLTLDDKVERLYSIKKSIQSMHDIGIIHGDLHYGNVLIDSDSYTNKIIDFDNCAYKNYKINKIFASDYANCYIEKYGVNKGLDIFLFNLMTYSILNCSPYFQTRIRICNEKYGIFKTGDGKKICNNLLLDKSNYDEKYLIDTCLHLTKK